MFPCRYRKPRLFPETKLSKKKNNRVPFVTSYNPALPDLSNIIHKHFHIFQGSERLKEPPIVAFRKPKSIRQFLVRAKVNNDADFNEMNSENSGCFKLHSKNCKLCHVLQQTDSFSSTVTNRTYKIKQKITCKSKGVIYLVTCLDCNKQYVGETGTTFSTRHTVTEVTFRRNLICRYPSIFYKLVVRLTEFLLSVLNFKKVMQKQENRKKVGGNTN